MQDGAADGWRGGSAGDPAEAEGSLRSSGGGRRAGASLPRDRRGAGRSIGGGLLPALLFPAFLAGCGDRIGPPGSSVSSSIETIHLVDLADPRDIQVLEPAVEIEAGEARYADATIVAERELWLSDQGSAQIHRYTLEGEWIGALQGASESRPFETVGWLESCRGGVYVQDLLRNELVVFTEEGTHDRTLSGPMHPSGLMSSRLVCDGGHLGSMATRLGTIPEETGPVATTAEITFFDEDGEAIGPELVVSGDPFLRVPNSIAPRDLAERRLFGIAADHLLLGMTDEAEIELHTLPEGRALATLGTGWTAEPLQRREIGSYIDWVMATYPTVGESPLERRTRYTEMEWPDFLPVWEAILTDGSGVWVKRYEVPGNRILYWRYIPVRPMALPEFELRTGPRIRMMHFGEGYAIGLRTLYEDFEPSDSSVMIYYIGRRPVS